MSNLKGRITGLFDCNATATEYLSELSCIFFFNILCFFVRHPLISSNANACTSPSRRAAFLCPDWLVRISFRILTARPDKVHLQTRSQTGSSSAGDSCGNTLSVLWMVGSRLLSFNASWKNLQLISWKGTSELEGVWSSTEPKPV